MYDTKVKFLTNFTVESALHSKVSGVLVPSNKYNEIAAFRII